VSGLGTKVVIGGKLVEDYTPPQAQRRVRRHRGHIKMVFNFLVAVQKTDRPTRIMDQRAANLAHRKLKAIVSKLKPRGLIEVKMTGSRIYSIIHSS